MTPEERSVHDALLPIGDFGVVARHVTKALIADGWTFAAAAVTDAVREWLDDALRFGDHLRTCSTVRVPGHVICDCGWKYVATHARVALSRQAEKETA
jgi:hypothetical protein